jgi:hypothetical protein
MAAIPTCWNNKTNKPNTISSGYPIYWDNECQFYLNVNTALHTYIEICKTFIISMVRFSTAAKEAAVNENITWWSNNLVLGCGWIMQQCVKLVTSGCVTFWKSGYHFTNKTSVHFIDFSKCVKSFIGFAPDLLTWGWFFGTGSGPGAGVVVVVRAVVLDPVKTAVRLGLHSLSGLLDMADQVMYMMYIVMTEAWKSVLFHTCCLYF